MGEQAFTINQSASSSRVKKLGHILFFPLIVEYLNFWSSQCEATSHRIRTGDTPCATRLLAVKSSLPTVIRTGSRKKEVAKRRTASGHVALTALRVNNNNNAGTHE